MLTKDEVYVAWCAAIAAAEKAERRADYAYRCAVRTAGPGGGAAAFQAAANDEDSAYEHKREAKRLEALYISFE